MRSSRSIGNLVNSFAHATAGAAHNIKDLPKPAGPVAVSLGKRVEDARSLVAELELARQDLKSSTARLRELKAAGLGHRAKIAKLFDATFGPRSVESKGLRPPTLGRVRKLKAPQAGK